MAECHAMDTFWSPEPITGYRMWNVFRDRMHGFFSVWREPTFQATCSRVDADTDVPHLNDVCRCGIYAAKDPEWLRWEFAGTAGPNVAMARVELTGRVIEYTAGYRAEKARVVDIAVRTRKGAFHFGDPEEITKLFADPHAALTDALTRPGAATLGTATDLAELVTT